MTVPYILDIEFPAIDFDSFDAASEKISLFHRAHLYLRENEIEIKVFFKGKTRFDEKFMLWVGQINWRKFGTYIEASNEQQNPTVKRIDFSESGLCGVSSGGNPEGAFEMFLIRIDSIKLYRQPSTEKLNTAEFYFDDSGFKVVKGFYSVLLETDDAFRIQRMLDSEEFYKIDESEFRPEFAFRTTDERNSMIATIKKEPKIHFKLSADINEQLTFKYGDVIRLLASFFFHADISYSVSVLYLKENTVILKNIKAKAIDETSLGLSALGLNISFAKFLKTDWQAGALKNHEKLQNLIRLFNQARMIGGTSCFLIRFNIIELCLAGLRFDKNKFETILPADDVNRKYDDALTSLLQTIAAEDHQSFRDKWLGLKSKLQFKPMKSPIEEFLRKERIPVDKFPVSLRRLKEIRDSLTHGSTDSVTTDELEKANKLLYGVTGILILNLIGSFEWQLYTEIN